MSEVNSQGLTWLEWRNAAGFNHPIDSWVWNGLRNAWKAGVDPAEYRNEPTQMYADEDMFPPGA